MNECMNVISRREKVSTRPAPTRFKVRVATWSIPLTGISRPWSVCRSVWLLGCSRKRAREYRSISTNYMSPDPMPTGLVSRADHCKGVEVFVQCRPNARRGGEGRTDEHAMPDIGDANWWSRRLGGRRPADARWSPAGLGHRREAFRCRGAEGLGSWSGTDGEGQHPGGSEESPPAG